MQKNKRIVVCGPGGGGKSYLANLLSKRGFSRCITCTSRPPRSSESNGVDYHFITKEYFEKNKNLFYEIDEFNGWVYGILIEDFLRCDSIIMTPRGVKSLRPEDRESSFVIYVNPPREVIHRRLSERNDADSVERRMLTDAEAFDGFSDFDIEITSPEF